MNPTPEERARALAFALGGVDVAHRAVITAALRAAFDDGRKAGAEEERKNETKRCIDDIAGHAYGDPVLFFYADQFIDEIRRRATKTEEVGT